MCAPSPSPRTLTLPLTLALALALTLALTPTHTLALTLERLEFGIKGHVSSRASELCRHLRRRLHALYFLLGRVCGVGAYEM